jgi:hypothetical protein
VDPRSAGGGRHPPPCHTYWTWENGAVGMAAAFGYSEALLKGETTIEPKNSTAHAVTDLWCSLECTPPCQGGGRGFKSRQVRRQIRSVTMTIEPGHPVG